MRENRSPVFPTLLDTNQAVQAQKIVRSLKFWILDEEGFYYQCSENKGADQLCSYCTFVFAYAVFLFSGAQTQINPTSSCAFMTVVYSFYGFESWPVRTCWAGSVGVFITTMSVKTMSENED